MVARLTPDQKVACSIHVGFNTPNLIRISFVFQFITQRHQGFSHSGVTELFLLGCQWTVKIWISSPWIGFSIMDIQAWIPVNSWSGHEYHI
ncbi:hypothetical protein BRADI_5g12212v3 [Brachypodium distachyon]|uniref:Uncharacterized protein n=1 Tax=Brachypodium distachyon TaxID=15368 RepID=A0A2K2CGR4_BRADI|nr:hypothetical protein BRADI_5g12212v3 [Brachypodium distachyon]